MEQERFEYRRTGEGQAKPDMVIDLKRVTKKQIQEWTPEQRRLAADWLKQVERAFNRFKTDILTA